MSAARDLYLAPPNCKKAHLSKGSSETAAIVRFAIDLLDDPLLQSVIKDDWNRLDLPDAGYSTFARPAGRSMLALYTR